MENEQLCDEMKTSEGDVTVVVEISENVTDGAAIKL